MVRFTALQQAGLVRRETFEGEEYLVVPVVALVEGVVNGELALAEEFGHFIESWNGRPVVYRHPYKRGVPISANSPEVLQSFQLGQIFNARLDGKKFKAEMWINLERANSLGEEVMERISAMERGEPVEVSTGYWADIEPVSGTFNGRQYTGVQRGIKPDHLAVLAVDEVGACNWQDGCGAPRVAHDRSGGGDQLKPGKIKAILESAMRALGLVPNEELSHDGVRDALRSTLNAALTATQYMFIHEVFDSYVVYAIMDDADGTERLYRQSYVVGQDNTITLAEDRTEVVQEVSYVPVTANEDGTDLEPEPEETAPEDASGPPSSANTGDGDYGDGRQKVNNQKDGDSQVNKKEKINALITNSVTQWAEEDRATLEAMDEAVLDKLLPVEETPDPKVNGETETPAVETTPTTPEDVIANIQDPELRAEFARMLRDRRDRREAMVTELVNNKRCRFSEERLRAMGDEDLEALHDSLKPEDYSGRPVPRTHAQEDDAAPPAPPSVILAPVNN